MPPIVPTLSEAQSRVRDIVAAATAAVLGSHGTPATYLRAGGNPDLESAAINVEFRAETQAGVTVAGQRVPSSLLSAGSVGQVLRGRVSVPMVRGGELIDLATGVSGSGGVYQLRVGDRLIFRAIDLGVPQASATATVAMAVRRVEQGQGVWTAEVSAA